MPVNLNPPPLPTPDTARSAQAPMVVDDDPVAADLFAQLVAAASINPPLAVSGEGVVTLDDGTEPKPEAPSIDAPIVDWTIALGMPISLPAAPRTDAAREGSAQDDRSQRAGPAPTGANRINAAASRVVELDAARVTDRAPATLERSDARVATADSTLRTQLAAALAPRIGAQPAPGTTPAIANDAQRPEAPSTPRSASNVSPLVAALTAAVDRERTPERDSLPRPAATEAPTAAATPPAAPGLAPHTAPQPAQITIAAPVGSPGFGEEVAAKVAHVVLRNDRAELKLSPAELGPVDIRIDFKSDSATLTIVAAQPATREALEQALPHLRESLAAQGIALGQATIHDGRAQQDRRPNDGGAFASHANARDDDAAPVIAVGRVRLSDRLVDTFA